MGSSKVTYEDMVSHPEIWGTKLPKWADELAARGYRGVCAVDFYGDIFGEYLEEERMPEDYRRGEYAGIAIEKVKKRDEHGELVLDSKGNPRYIGKRYTITKGNMKLYNLIDQSDNFCMIAPISYAGRVRKNENARFMYALCIEVDHLEPKNGLHELIWSWKRGFKAVPEPTYIVCSGSGVHLYYVFDKPIPLWRNIFEQLTEIKKHFTPFLWSKYISLASEAIQYESINQPFRCVGSRTKDNSYALAFRVGKRLTIEKLNSFLSPKMKLNCVYKAKHTLEEAKRLYPEWYQRRIEEGKDRGHYNRYKPIYFNWIKKILDKDTGAVEGKRYNCLENLCSLAVQCNIEPEQVEADCRRVAEHFEKLTDSEDNHFTEYDVLCALRTYHNASEQAYRRRIEYISNKTGIALVPNKRNGRKQVVHLMGARALQDINDKVNGTNWRDGNGRPDKAQQVYEYRAEHQDARKADCIRDTGLAKMTVYKWWNWQPEHEKTVDEMTDEEYEELFYHEFEQEIQFENRKRNNRWSKEDQKEYDEFQRTRKALVSPLKRKEMQEYGFKVSQEAGYDAFIADVDGISIEYSNQLFDI